MRRQLPVYSPLSARSIALALDGALRPAAAPGPQLVQSLSERYGARDVTLFGSGTQALTAAIRAAVKSVGPGRPVALPAYTCYDVATAAIGAGANIVLYDVDPGSLAPEWESVERGLRAGAGVVVLSYLYGLPFDWRPARELAQQHGALLLEDAAQGAGAEWGGRKAGSFGDLSVLSFGRGKGWTGGSGGAVMVGGDASVELPQPPVPGPAIAAKLLATVVAQWSLGWPAVYGLPHALPWLHLGETRYHAPQHEVGMTRLSAALVGATEALARAEDERRKRAGAALNRALREIPGVATVQYDAAAEPGFLRLPCRITDPRKRSRALARGGRYGLEVGYPSTLLDLEPVRRRLVDAAPGGGWLEGAETLVSQLVTLPVHGRTTDDDRQAILRCLRD